MGFTEQEVQALCTQYGVSFEETKAWYDGYKLKNIGSIYNPRSVVMAMHRKDFSSYWTQTEIFTALQKYLEWNIDGVQDAIIALMSGERRKINTQTFANDMETFNCADDVLTLLVHLGYLGYDAETKEVFIPNYEILMEFQTATKTSAQYNRVAAALKNSDALVAATLAGDAEAVAQGIENAHQETSHLQYHDENALAYTVSLAYYSIRKDYGCFRELPTGKGFADMVFVPLPHARNKPAIVVELKWDKSAQGALRQIKDKQYPESLKDWHDKIILVGINYDKQTKAHQCVIETS